MLDRGNDADQIATTNIAKDGEAAFDEFRANVVQAAVRVPIDGSGQPLRGFSPFRLETKDKEKEKGFNLQSPNTPEAREALQSPVAAGAAASADADAGLESQRVYDENGNRDRSKRPQAGAAEAQGRVRRPGADSGEGEMIDEEAYSDPASEAQARPKDAAKEAVNPEQIFKDLADPDAQQPAQPGGDEETQGGFVEEELW
jgi:hypothetical protein